MVGLHVASLVLVVIYSLAKYVQRRCVARRRVQYIRRPILGDAEDLNAHERLPHLPPQVPIEFANPNLNNRDFVLPPASPIILNRRQFPAPGSPNLQLLSPRQRQSAQRRLPYEYPLPPSPPATLVAPFPATPPRSPVPDLALYPSRLNSPVRIHNRVHAENAALFNTDFTTRLLPGPPRSPLARMTHFAPESHKVSSITIEERLQPFTRKEFVLPIETPSPISPPLQSIPSEENPQSIASPNPPALSLLPSPFPAEPSAASSASPLMSTSPQRRSMRRAPSFPATPSPVPEFDVTARSSGKTTTPKKMKRHSIVFATSTSQSCSPVPQAGMLHLGSHILPFAPLSPHVSDGRPEFAVDGEIAGEIVEDRLTLADVHNTTPIRTEKPGVVEIPILETSQLRLPPGKYPSALISPVKAIRQVDRGPDPVYQYSNTPAVAVRKSVVRPVQDDFKSFSASLGVKFGQKGWASTGPNELAPAKKGKKKKKKAAAKGSGVFPSPNSNLPASRQTNCTGSPWTRPKPSVTSGTVNTGCHPNCADIYCPGGCSEVEL